MAHSGPSSDLYQSFMGLPAFVLPWVNCPSQETEVTSTPTRPVENVVITTKGLQENKGKLILTEIFPSVQKHDI